MKKIYTLIFASAFSLLAFNTNAATVNIGVGTDGTGLANQFFPSTVSANVGDLIHFINAGGTHSVVGTSLPGGAAAMSSTTMTTPGATYDYTVTVAGTYTYHCGIHGTGMSGTINVSPTGIATSVIDMSTNAYPNPFSDKITFKYNSIDAIQIVNVVGEMVKTIDPSPLDTKVTVDFEGIPSGIYFYRTFKEGILVETRKIVKAK